MENYLLPNLVEKFVDYLKTQGRSQFTIVAYKKDLQQFVGFIASKQKTDVREIIKEDIDAFLNKLLQENYTKKSASRKLNSIRTFFRYLKKGEIINQNPSLDVAHPKYTLVPPRILSEIEYRALRDATKEDPRTYAMVEIMLQTGIKIGELVALRLEDIKENSLYIRSYGKNPPREVPLNKAAKKAINQYLKARNKSNFSSDYLFITRTGKPVLVRNVRQVIVRYFNEVGINKATINDLRNTFITHQLINGASLEYIARIVGHRRLSSTERYLNLVKEVKKKEEKLGEL